MRRRSRSAGPAERSNAPLPHQGGSRGSSYSRRLAIRSGPRHHHVPRALADNHLNSNTTDRQQHGRSRRGPRRGARRGPRPQAAHPQRHATATAPALEPTPCDTTPVPFTSLGLDARLLEGVRDLGFRDTRPIQTAVIPLALGGHDLIACAETGSGKTSAFVVPTLQRLLTTPRPDVDGAAAATRSRVLVLAPTRELAVQIEDEIHR